MIARETLARMREVAKAASKNSNEKDESHRIGAAVLGESGKIYGGCNLLSIPQDTCAERVALYKAISEGEKRVEAVLIYREHKLGSQGGPCGHCLQDLWNLSNNPQLEIYSWHGNMDEPRAGKILDYLPHPYTPEAMKQ